MTSIKWSELETFEDWKGALQKILDAAQAASSDGDEDACLDLCDTLNEFIRKSAPNTPEIRELDRIASDALGRIAQRTATLIALSKAIDRVASEAAESASALRLEKFHAAIDAITQAQRTIEGIQDTFRKGSDDALKKQISDLLTQLEKARSVLDKKK